MKMSYAEVQMRVNIFHFSNTTAFLLFLTRDYVFGIKSQISTEM